VIVERLEGDEPIRATRVVESAQTARERSRRRLNNYMGNTMTRELLWRRVNHLSSPVVALVDSDPPEARRRHRVSLLTGALGVALLVSGARTAMATDQGSTAASDETSLAEIVITAEKRASTVQEAPVSITALTGDQLGARGIDTIEQIVQQVPGLSMRTAGPGMTEFEMRGLSSTGGVAPTVGFYFDDAPLSPPLTSFSGKTVLSPEMYDLSRVEVLRGPQGTLYGSGAMGGVVRLVTNAPDLQRFTGSVNVNLSGTVGANGPNSQFNAAINFPLIEDRAALRVVVGEKWVSGWIDRIVDNPFPFPTNNGCTPTGNYGCARGDVLAANVVADHKGVNWEHTTTARAELLVQPVDALKVLTTVFFDSTYQGGPNEVDQPPGPGGTAAHYQPVDIAEPYFDRFLMFSNTINGDLGFADLTAASVYWNRTQQIISDGAEGYQSLFFLPNFLNETDQAWWLKNPSRQFSEEVRLSSKGNGPLKWIGGLFYSHEASTYFSYGAVKGMCALSTGGCAANPLGITYFSNSPFNVTQYAGFGELSYTYNDVTATVGGRWFRYDNNWAYYTSGIFTLFGNATPVSGDIAGSNKGFTPKFNLSYEPNKNLTVYATAAEGFRDGGVNLPVPDSCLADLGAIGVNGQPYNYAPDRVWSYELGEKAQLADNRFTINADFYYNDWKQVQQQVNLACAFEVQLNAGRAATYGPEVEFSIRLTPELTLDANGTYTHATVNKPTPGLGIAPGTPLLNVPQYQENTSLTYRRSVGTDAVFTARLSNILVGPTHDLAYANYLLPSYDLVNARVELSQGRFSYGLFANNITNKQALLTSNNTVMDFNIPSLTRLTVTQPVTVGLDVKFRF
jgi:outer membrane receptor protein involved in Fe transport